MRNVRNGNKSQRDLRNVAAELQRPTANPHKHWLCWPHSCYVSRVLLQVWTQRSEPSSEWASTWEQRFTSFMRWAVQDHIGPSVEPSLVSSLLHWLYPDEATLCRHDPFYLPVSRVSISFHSSPLHSLGFLNSTQRQFVPGFTAVFQLFMSMCWYFIIWITIWNEGSIWILFTLGVIHLNFSDLTLIECFWHLGSCY